MLEMVLVHCAWCTWSLAFQEGLEAAAMPIADSHVRYHERQMVADVTSFLEEIADAD